MSLLYIDGKAVNPEEDICLMEYCEGAFLSERIYATKRRTFYKITKCATERDRAEIIQRGDVRRELNKNPAYILTEGYDAVFGKPKRV